MNKKVLVVEDEESLSRILCDQLRHHGYTVLSAVNGKEGLAITEAEMPAIVLLDIVMPVMDGITYLKEKRKIDKIANIPVIILSNLSDPQLEDQSGSFNVSDYLIKSDWKLEDIIKKVQEKIGL